jgi:hypothetical protein
MKKRRVNITFPNPVISGVAVAFHHQSNQFILPFKMQNKTAKIQLWARL